MLDTTIDRIGPLDQAAMEEARRHHDSLAIPRGSLGMLHEFGVRLAGITGTPLPEIKRLAVVTMAGDHGVTAQGVSCFPSEVTCQMVRNFLLGGAAINVLTRHVGARLTVVDMGVAGKLPEIALPENRETRFLSRRIADGTKDISRGPAMSMEYARLAVETGIRVFEEERELGLDALGTGDMGIGNTTPSSAIAAVLLKRDPADLVNRGTGLDDEALRKKVEVVSRALEVNAPDPENPLDVLAKLGGYEIGGIAGLVLAACVHRIPVVVDGFISTSAALLASRFHPYVKDYLFSGHRSHVLGHDLMLSSLNLRPIMDLDMRLGEGTGAAFGLSIIAAASRIGAEMLTFEQAAVTNPNEAKAC